MSKRTWVVLLISGFIALGASWLLGYGMGKRAYYDAKVADRQAQVECLKRMWGVPFSLDLYQQVQSMKHDPEAVRAHLLDQAHLIIRMARDKFVSTGRSQMEYEVDNPYSLVLEAGGEPDLPGRGPEKHIGEIYRCIRAKRLLELWVPGQTEIRETLNPNGKEKSPLWDLYLSSPDEAFHRGVSARGEGGK
jgi:hypothetical protein